LIVALGHKKFVGKDTVANILCDRLGTYLTKRVSFAAPLKTISHQLFGYGGLKDGDYYETHTAEKMAVLPLLGKSPRDIWIAVGNDMRQIHSEVWCQAGLSQAKNAATAIVTDLRYPNEAKALDEAGAVLVKIERAAALKTDDVADCALDGYDGWDIVYNNLHPNLDALRDDVVEHLVPAILEIYKEKANGRY